MKTTIQAKMTSKGQLTVPKKVRKDLGLNIGTTVEFSPVKDGYLIRKSTANSPFRKWKGHLKGLRGENPDILIDEMRGE